MYQIFKWIGSSQVIRHFLKVESKLNGSAMVILHIYMFQVRRRISSANLQRITHHRLREGSLRFA